jgi:hypothetical protein
MGLTFARHSFGTVLGCVEVFNMSCTSSSPEVEAIRCKAKECFPPYIPLHRMVYMTLEQDNSDMFVGND